jgi:hypothetical protein
MLAAEERPEVPYKSPGGPVDLPTAAPDMPGGYPEAWEEKWAFHGITPNLEETGMAQRQFSDVARKESAPPGSSVKLLIRGAKLNLPALVKRLGSSWMGRLLLPLALVGLALALRRRPRAVAPWYVVALSAAPLIATFFVQWSDARYFFIFAPFMYTWASNAIVSLGAFLAPRFPAAWSPRLRTSLAEVLVPGLFVLVMSLTPAVNVRYLYTFRDSDPSHRIEKDTGLWIRRQQDHRVTIVDTALPLSFHANVKKHVFMPYCEGSVALRYFDAVKADYIVLRPPLRFTKYYSDWVANGIPHPRAKLVYRPIDGTEALLIYRWNWAAAAVAQSSVTQPPPEAAQAGLMPLNVAHDELARAASGRQ